MTGYTVHTGASKKFVAGWDNIFSDSNKENDKQPAAAKKKTAAKKPAKKKKKKD